MPGPHEGNVPGQCAVARPMRELRLPAEPPTASLVRDAVRRWLAAQAWPSEHAIDILLAVNEAVTNAIQHAYNDGGPPGPVQVSGELRFDDVARARRVVLIVADVGRWRDGTDLRNARGLPLMHACMEVVTIGRAATGTHVTLVSRPAPA